jgi:hypothetical protein
MCAGINAPFGRFASLPDTIVIWRVSLLKTQKGAVILYALRYELGTEERVETADLTTYPAASNSAMRVAKFFAALSDTEWVYFVRLTGASLISIFIFCFLFDFVSLGVIPCRCANNPTSMFGLKENNSRSAKINLGKKLYICAQPILERMDGLDKNQFTSSNLTRLGESISLRFSSKFALCFLVTLC